MKEESEILSKVGRKTGFTVPDGYFEKFAAEMKRKLPEKEFRREPVPTRWQRIRPWVYMAAMFAGVWCMMQIFADIKNAANDTLAFNPDVAEAMTDETFVDEYMMLGEISDYDLLIEMYNDGVDADIFKTAANQK